MHEAVKHICLPPALIKSHRDHKLRRWFPIVDCQAQAPLLKYLRVRRLKRIMYPLLVRAARDIAVLHFFSNPMPIIVIERSSFSLFHSWLLR